MKAPCVKDWHLLQDSVRPSRLPIASFVCKARYHCNVQYYFASHIDDQGLKGLVFEFRRNKVSGSGNVLSEFDDKGADKLQFPMGVWNQLFFGSLNYVLQKQCTKS